MDDLLDVMHDEGSSWVPYADTERELRGIQRWLGVHGLVLTSEGLARAEQVGWGCAAMSHVEAPLLFSDDLPHPEPCCEPVFRLVPHTQEAT